MSTCIFLVHERVMKGAEYGIEARMVKFEDEYGECYVARAVCPDDSECYVLSTCEIDTSAETVGEWVSSTDCVCPSYSLGFSDKRQLHHDHHDFYVEDIRFV